MSKELDVKGLVNSWLILPLHGKIEIQGDVLC